MTLTVILYNGNNRQYSLRAGAKIRQYSNMISFETILGKSVTINTANIVGWETA